jgi:excisionase family DNA binding protein
MNTTSPTKADAVAATRAVLLPEVLDVEALAYWLRCSPSSARAHLRAGRIRGRRIGRRWLISREAVLRALASEREQAPMRVVGGGR